MLMDNHMAESVWRDFSMLEAESAINAFRRWHATFAMLDARELRGPSLQDPYVRLVLDRVLPAEIEKQLLAQPLDKLLQDIIAVRTQVIDEHVMNWVTTKGIRQVLILNSGFDTRPWRLKWPQGTSVFEVDTAMVSAQKLLALGDVKPNCERHAVIGDMSSLGSTISRLQSCGFSSNVPTILVIEDVVEHMLPSVFSEACQILHTVCGPGSQMVVTLSDMKLREMMRTHSNMYMEDYEPPGITLNRLANAGWNAWLVLPGELENRFQVELHGCLYLALAERQPGSA